MLKLVKILTVALLSSALLGTDCPMEQQGSPDLMPANDNSSGIAAFFKCGERTVASVPENVFIEKVSVMAEFSVEPADSALAKALFASAICPGNLDQGAGKLLYNVGANGQVVETCVLFEILGKKTFSCASGENMPIGLRFEVLDDCLLLRTDDDQSDADFDLVDVLIADGDAPETLCEAEQFPVSNGEIPFLVQGGDDFICLKTEITTFCTDCGFEEGVWYKEIEYRYRLTACGDLSGVSARLFSEVCDSDEMLVDIRQGDQVTFTTRGREEYRISQSPEELGYSSGLPLPAIP